MSNELNEIVPFKLTTEVGLAKIKKVMTELVTDAKRTLKAAMDFKVVTDEDCKKGKQDFNVLRERSRDIENCRKEVVLPLNDIVKTVNSACKEPMEIYDQARSIVEKKVVAYESEKERARLAEERRLREEAERKERAIREERERQEREQRAKEAAKLREAEEIERKAREEVERQERERKAKEDAERRAKEEAERKIQDAKNTKERARLEAEEAKRREAAETARKAIEARQAKERAEAEEAAFKARKAAQDAQDKANERAIQAAAAFVAAPVVEKVKIKEEGTKDVTRWGINVVDESKVPFSIEFNGENVRLWALDVAVLKKIANAHKGPSMIPGVDFYSEKKLS